MKLKGLLKGFFILGLTLLPISFSSAISQDYYSPFSITSRCLYEVDYNITNNGVFTSYYNGIEKSNLLYFKGGTYSDCRGQQYIVFGWKNGKLYGFTRNDAGGVNQGYLNYYCYGAEPCSNMNVSSDTMINVLNNQGIKGLYLSTPNTSVFPDDGFNQNHIACFITNSQSVPYLCFYSGYPSNYSFSESLDYNVSDWDNLSSWDGFFDKSPLSSYTPLPDVPYSGSVPCYTIGQLFESSPKYNTGLCYSSSLQVVGGSLTNVEPQSITQLFPTYSDFRNSLNLYYNYCQSPGTSQSCSDAFTGNYAGYSLISKIPSDVHTNDLYDICSMYLTYGYDKNVCELTGTQITPSYYTSEGYAEYIRQRPIEYITPNSGTLFDGLVKDGGNSAGITNLFGLEQLFSNIMGFFSEYNGNNGILPGFIGFAFLGFCLFYLFKR